MSLAIGFALISAHLSCLLPVRPSFCLLMYQIFPQNRKTISSKICINHSWVKGVQIFHLKGLSPVYLRLDDNKILEKTLITLTNLFHNQWANSNQHPDLIRRISLLKKGSPSSLRGDNNEIVN